MKTKDIHQTELFNTDANDLYKCIMDSRIHSSFTGGAANIEDKEETLFDAFDGYITGKNMVLERGKKIVQTWRADEEGWPENHFSEVVFIFTALENNKTQLDFYHTAIPEHKAESIANGWKEFYWEPLKIYLDR
jgi:activator of HSP90 ATPase